ncbi:MAG: TonB-dependent receptor [Chromatocurvus sp.]
MTPTRTGTCQRLRFALLVAVLTPLLAHADPGGLVVTTVDAKSGRNLAGVRVEVTDRDGQTVRGFSGEQGEARFDGLEEGFYRIEASAEGRVLTLEPIFRVIARRTAALELQLPALAREVDTPLEEVLVVARARQADPLSGVSSTFRNRDELRNAVGAGPDVMRALDGLPGLASDGAFAGFTVRGRGPRNNLIFVDDFPLDKVVHFDQTIGEEDDIAGGGRFSIFAPNSVAGAEFSPGGWGAAYGGRAGSLLRLELAEGGLTPVTSLRLDIAGAEFTYDGPAGITKDTSVFFTARRFDFGNVFELIGQEDIGTPKVTDVIFKTTTRLSDRDELQFLLIHAPEDFTRDLDNVAESDDFEDVSLIEAKQDLSLVGLTWRRQVGESGEWSNRLYLRSSDKDSTQGEAFPDLAPVGAPADMIPARQEIFSILEREEEIGWRSDFTRFNRFGEFSAGLRAVRIDADFETRLDGPWNRFVYESEDPRPEGQQYIVWRPENIEASFGKAGTNLAAYVEQVVELGRFEVRPGLRVDRDAFSKESYLSPRLSVGYKATPNLRFALTSGLFHESPRFLVRAADPDNFDLANEEITHVSLGLDYTLNDAWNVIAEIYHQELADLVVDQSRATRRALNVGEGTNSGLDLVLQRAFDNGWSADLTYSYNRGRQDDKNGRGSYPPDFSREHFFSIGSRWEITDRLQLAARWKWGSGRPGDAFVIHRDVLPGSDLLRASKEITEENAITLGDYQSLNVRVDYRRRMGPLDVLLFLDVINVYAADRGSPEEFNPITGRQIEDDASPFPQFGLILERAW